MGTHYDTIVLGLGAVGSATTYQLAKRGNRVLGIDQFSPPHTLGSTHGESRITRQAIGEGEAYVPLALRSHEIWDELERETGETLLTNTAGGLIISSGAVTVSNHVENFFENTVAAAKRFDIGHEILTADEIRKRFPQFNVRDNEMGYFEHKAGFLRPENCVRVQLALAEKHGAELHRNERVLTFTQEGTIVHVTTDKGEYTAEKLIVCAGPWLPNLIDKKYGHLFSVIRQVMYWFDVKESIEPFLPEHCPIYIWELQGNTQGLYGFPAIDGSRGGVKMASEQYETQTTADSVVREVSEEEKRAMYENFVAPYFPGLSDRCLKAVACLYTNTPDSGFVIDTHPEFSSVILASPCSGHGFKHSAAVGEALSQVVIDGQSKINLSAFRLNRFLGESAT